MTPIKMLYKVRGINLSVLSNGIFHSPMISFTWHRFRRGEYLLGGGAFFSNQSPQMGLGDWLNDEKSSVFWLPVQYLSVPNLIFNLEIKFEINWDPTTWPSETVKHREFRGYVPKVGLKKRLVGTPNIEAYLLRLFFSFFWYSTPYFKDQT